MVLILAIGGASSAAVGAVVAERPAQTDDPSAALGVGASAGELVAIAVGLESSATGSYPTELLVEPPQGPLGPQTSVVIDPETVPGISFDGVRWIVEPGVTFDEQEAGGYLEFDAPTLVTGSGVVIDGARFVEVDSGSGYVLSGERPQDEFEARHVEVAGGAGAAAVGGLGENVTLEHFSVVDFDGDGLKPASGWTVADGRIHIRGDETAGKHYDGIQVTGAGGVTLSRIEISMVGSGTAAVFVHEGRGNRAPNVVHDIVVTHAPDIFHTLRFDATVIAYNLQGMGPVRTDRLPTAFILAKRRADIDWGTVYSTFDAPVPVN